MAVYCISDIHGERKAFHAMLEKIHLSAFDTLYVIGDVIDRGPDSITLLMEIMKMNNVQMLLGNHELMMLNYYVMQKGKPQADIWCHHGAHIPRADFEALTPWEQDRILDFLFKLPDSLDVEVNGRKFFLVHGYPGENTHDAVWGRPIDLQVEPPLPGRQLIVGHTPVPLMRFRTNAEIEDYLRQLEREHGHVEILHAPGFIDIDCGCGHQFPGRALGCLRLDDMEEFYVPLPL